MEVSLSDFPYDWIVWLAEYEQTWRSFMLGEHLA
jgi:hypothetical protein